MNCKYMAQCTYFKDASEIGGTLQQNTEKFCHDNGNGCAFFILIDKLGPKFVPPPNLVQSDTPSAEQIAQNEMPCWVFKDCPEETKTNCPAFINKKGKFCWLQKGTLCGGNLQGCFIDKLTEACEKCDYYHRRKKTSSIKSEVS